MAPPVAAPESRDVALLRSEIAAVAGKLSEMDARLRESQRQVVSFQVYVEKLVAGGGETAVSPARPPLRSAPIGSLVYRPAVTVPPLHKNDTLAALVASVGRTPDFESKPQQAKFGGSWKIVRWKGGVTACVNAKGRVEWVELGAARGFTTLSSRGAVSSMGSSTSFVDKEDENRFRESVDEDAPVSWSYMDVEIGMSDADLVARLGNPDDMKNDEFGTMIAYSRLNLVIWTWPPPISTVKCIEHTLDPDSD
jgi:hypothetical protein